MEDEKKTRKIKNAVDVELRTGAVVGFECIRGDHVFGEDELMWMTIWNRVTGLEVRVPIQREDLFTLEKTIHRAIGGL